MVSLTAGTGPFVDPDRAEPRPVTVRLAEPEVVIRRSPCRGGEIRPRYRDVEAFRSRGPDGFSPGDDLDPFDRSGPVQPGVEPDVAVAVAPAGGDRVAVVLDQDQVGAVRETFDAAA